MQESFWQADHKAVDSLCCVLTIAVCSYKDIKSVSSELQIQCLQNSRLKALSYNSSGMGLNPAQGLLESYQ